MQRFDRERETRSTHFGAGRVEDYTGPFLVVTGVLCFVFLFAVWAVFGFPFTITLAFLTERLFLRG